MGRGLDSWIRTGLLAVAAASAEADPGELLRAADRSAGGPPDRPQAEQDDPPGRTPYLAAMLGSSFPPREGGGPLLITEGAVGVSLPRPAGAVRVEVEGRRRAALSGTGGGRRQAAGGGEWTTMGNAWRDVDVAEHLSVYGGGGIGVGGPTRHGIAGAGAATDLAWQVGAGVACGIGERLTLDIGCRCYGLTPGDGRPAGTPAAEMLFAVRIAEPFRGWLRH